MGGYVVWRPPPPGSEHVCEPPKVADPPDGKYVFDQVKEPRGTLWRCDCGKLWSVRWSSDGTRRVWRRASLAERWRVRDVEAPAPPPPTGPGGASQINQERSNT